MKIILVALSLLMLVGCGKKPDREHVIERVDTYTSVIILEDGTRCATISSYGIDCDWKRHE